ncbi:outer membrane beta-barrel protein [soil metagenome]
MPGIKVDANGKIYSQGKAVDQVLVDGDEFFGTDPTTATKNLAASSVESIQVYDKKNEDGSTNDDKETLKIMDLKLKDDAKKGYFGKVSGASDFKDYYEGDFLANKFKGKQKISLYALATNTPKSRFDWNEMWKYNIDDGQTREYTDDGMMMSWNNDDGGGIPRTLKTGFYYTDKLSRKTKVTLNYSYANALQDANSETTSQYFLADTSYKSKQILNTHKIGEKHSPNLTIIQTIDSLTELELSSRLKYNIGSSFSTEFDTLSTNSDSITRTTSVNPSNSTTNYDWTNSAKLTHNFKKKERKLVVNYSLGMVNSETKGLLKSNDSSLPNNTDQKKTTDSDRQTHNASIIYTEPFTKKIKMELSYDMNYSKGKQIKKTLDYFNGDYNAENATYSNSFESLRSINRVGTKFTYEVKKYTFSVGAKVRQVYASNHNLESDSVLSQTVNNILPYSTLRYKFSDNKQLTLRYTTNSSQPDLNQLQPVPDNSNPNYIIRGNPNLLPTYAHSFNLDFYSWDLLSSRNFWSSIGYTTTQHSFANDISYNSVGITTSSTLNTDGNYNAYGYMGMGFPILEKLIEFQPNIDLQYSNYNSFVNSQKNTTKNLSPNFGLDVQIETDTIEIHVNGGINYNSTSTTLNTNSDQSYYSTNYGGSVEFTFPGKFRIESDAKYTRTYGREDAYNIDYLIWNASLSKTFLKSENLILSVSANDLLNQNINTYRSTQDNVTSDVKQNVIGRYFLFKIQFKFNSNKEKDDEEN